MSKYGLIKSTNAGFFSNFRGTVMTLHYCENNNLKPYVLWDSGLYQKNKGDNVWEYYFEQLNEPLKNSNDFVTVPHDYSWNRKPITRSRFNELIVKYVRIKPHILEKVNAYNFSDKNVLGIHLRLTDKNNCEKHGEPLSGRPVDIDLYIKHAEIYLKKNPKSVIFLATDSIEGVEKFQSKFSQNIIVRDEVIRSSGNISVHGGISGDPYKKGEDVLIDCLLLSKCSFLFKGISSVALTSLFFNPNLQHFNLNDFYNEDKRESFIEQELSYV